MKPTKDAALRKRTQIAKANRIMFLWVAVVSVVFGFALVGALFLTQILLFNERVLDEKRQTITTLRANTNNVSELEAQIRVLDTNQALIDAKSQPSDEALRVILDALPSEANSLALGASLQNILLADININALQVESVDGEPLEDGAVQDIAGDTGSQGEITFRFSVSGDEQALKRILRNLERSIRTIDVLSLRIEGQGASSVLTVQARAFYEPARTVELVEKVVR